MSEEVMVRRKPVECKMNDIEWDRYCMNISKPSPKDWCRICGHEVGDHEYMKYGFQDSKCRRCR